MAKQATRYNPREFQACVASRLLEDKKSVFVGTGLPMVASMLAQRTHAPGLLIVFEAGGIGPYPPVLPISVGDSRTFYRAVAASSMHDTLSAAQHGYMDYGFLGAAQLDMYGNINTTVIGDWRHPQTRLPGSGGANDLGSFCHRTIIIMRQDRQRFVEKVDFCTTPGYLAGPGARERAGLAACSGPYRVITQLGIYGFDPETRWVRLVSVHPGVTVEQIQHESSFEILLPPEVPVTATPTLEELRVLHEIDPIGISIGK